MTPHPKTSRRNGAGAGHGRRAGRILPVLAAAMALLGAPAGSVMAQTASDATPEWKPESGESAPGAAASRLEDLSAALRRNKEHSEKLKAEIGDIAQDRAKLNQRLLDTARRIKASEVQLERAEIRLQRLRDRRRIVQGSLKSRRKLLAELLAALQKIGHSPPPAIVVQPEDALGAIRSAMLLGKIVPGLRDEAEKLALDLKELSELHDAIAGERRRLGEKTMELAEEKVRIEALIASKQDSLKLASLQFEEARKRGEELSRETASLKDLIQKMDDAVSKVTGIEAREPREELAPEERRVALSDPGRIRPAMAFSDAKGTLALPVSGSMLRQFGEDDGLGGETRGISIETRPSAQVTSPCDGWVVYSGPFRSYGQLLIINAGGGYHVLLAGMSKASAQLGQFVLAGEPVGTMGLARSGSQIAAATANIGRPVLYVEFRKSGVSIDPQPWWASAEQEVRG